MINSSTVISSNQLSLSVVVLSFNEEDNLERCLSSMDGICREMFVVDSGSTDATLDIAGRYASVVHHPFETHAKQWRWALSNLPIKTQWILALDADQELTAEARSELKQLFTEKAELLEGVDGVYINRRQVFRGHWIKHGGYYPKYLLKLFRPDKVLIDCADLVDHHFYVSGKTLKLQHDLVERNRKEDAISFWIAKHNRYATLLAQEEFQFRQGARVALLGPSLLGNPDERTLWLKRAWRGLPLYVRPFLYFLFRYFFRLGFLDGKEGFIFHFLQAFWFRFLVDINLDELDVRGGPIISRSDLPENT